MSEKFYCIKCDKDYESNSKLDRKSNELKKYVKYLGYCSEECFNKLSYEKKEKELRFAYIYGDKKKREYSEITRFVIP